MPIRDRIKALRRVPASSLQPHPRNWRVHPAAQRNALKALLSEVGYAGALLARELDDGSLELIDGHLRAETTPDEMVPVLVLDVDADEAAKILATHDPLAAMAEADSEQLRALLDDVDTNDPAIEALLADLAKQAGASPLFDEAEDESEQLGGTYQVLVSCRDETQQRELIARLQREGLSCRALFT